MRPPPPIERRGRALLASTVAMATIAVAALAGAAPRAAAQPPAWELSQGESLLAVQISAEAGTLGSTFAHDHVARATEWSADLRYDPEDPSSCALRLEVPVRQLAVDDPATRRDFGLEPMSESNRADVRESMLAEGQLGADAHPTILITADSCHRTGASTVRALVTITVRDNPVTLPVDLHVQRQQGVLHVRGDFVIDHSEFGIEPYSAFFGAVRNAEPIRFIARIVARR